MKKNCILTVILVFVLGFSGCDAGENIDNINNKGTISVYAGAAASLEIDNNSRGFTFPNTYIGESAEVTIVVKNTGSGGIRLTGSPRVNLDGATAVFSVSSAPETSTIGSGSSSSFKIKFSPANATESYVYVSIPNNSVNAPDFSFTVYGTGVRPKPTASVFYGNNEITQNGIIQAGENIIITQSKEISVVIKNTGTALLTIDTANITITGADKDAFTLSSPPVGNVIAGGETFLRIECKPVKSGVNDATLTIPNNDESRSQIVIHLRATAVRGAPVLKLSQAGTDIANNSLTPVNFERVSLDSNKPLVFTIKNNGNINLELTGTPAVVSSNAVFTVQTQPTNKTISPNDDVSFILQYTPTDEKEDFAAITITSNSDDMVFTLNVKGTGYIKRPQITIKQGNSTVNQYGEYNFGIVAHGESKDVTFDIENTGEANLNIISVNGSRINLEDDTDGLFSVIQQPSAVVILGNSTNFVLRFSPTTEENNFTATVHIKTDSQDNDDFYFLVNGTGYVKKPQIVVQQGVSTINLHGEYNFGTVAAGKSSDITFTIRNSGDANLTFTTVDGNRINLTDNALGFFSVTQQPSASAVVTPTTTTTFVIRFSPATVGSNLTATVLIKTNSRDNDEFAFTVKGTARAANNEARLSGMQFSTGTLVPQFNSSIYQYDLRIQDGPTLVNVRPTSVDSNITAIRVNGVSQASGVLSQDIILASNNTVTIEVYAEDATSTTTYTVNIKIIKTWEKLHGAPGGRYGIFRAISNGTGGIYAGGWTSNNTAALFNIDGSGNLQNTFTFSSYDGTVGPTALGTEYNDYYSVCNTDFYSYWITKTTSPSVSPNRIETSYIEYNGAYVRMFPTGIVRNNNGLYFVAGIAGYAARVNDANYTVGVFVNRHYTDGSFEKGRTSIPVNISGIRTDTLNMQGMTLLSNGDVLLYGFAETTAGRTVAIALAVNVSATNAASWAVRWSNTYEIANKTSRFLNHFWDNSSNIILLGDTDDGGLVLKFPGSAATASAAKPSGWSKVITGTRSGFGGGLVINDGSGYLFVGEGAGGSNGGQDVWVVKTDANVNKIWEKFFGGAGYEWGGAVVEVSDGFIIGGLTQSPIIAGQTRKGTEDIYILKINKDGTMD